jgi:hypothetical protein
MLLCSFSLQKIDQVGLKLRPLQQSLAKFTLY